MGREEEIRMFFHGSPSTLVWSSVVEVNRRAAAWGPAILPNNGG
jgi:hypothetical protein